MLDDFDDAALAEDAALAAALLAIDAAGLGGAVLRGRTGGAGESWLGVLRDLMPDEGAVRRLPAHATDDRILGGLDLSATLSAGRPVVERGILAAADGCVLLIPSAERLPAATAAKVAAAMDTREVMIERDGLTQRHETRFSVIALDEGIDEETAPAALRDRLAFHLSLDAIGRREIRSDLTREDIAAAQGRLEGVALDDDAVEALCGVAAAFGVSCFNAVLLAVRAARCHAALHGRASPGSDDVVVAARLVLAPRATRLPQVDEEEPQDVPEQEPAEPEAEPSQRPEGKSESQDIVVAAAQAAIPPDLLARLMTRRSSRARGEAQRGSGASQRTVRRGRPTGTKRGALRAGARLNVLETLRAAAPWQSLRAQARREQARDGRRRVEVRPDDFRVRRMKDRRETVTVFVVDASGSTALHRLAEAKGAVELLLADCYVRRDQVALFSFGGRGTELLLPPTRSLTRAKRCLADLPGGGGTPLAEALERAAHLAQAIKRKNQTPAVVLLTDGRPNLCRDGRHGREAAEADAVAAAATLRHDGIASLLIDTSTRPDRGPARIAEAMGAEYVPLPFADAQSVSAEVRVRLGR